METKKLSDDLSVSGQIAPADLERLRASGFRSVIVNRPNSESPDQPTFAQIRVAAAAVGIEARYLPVVTGKVSSADAAAFSRTLDELPKPSLAFCRSGTRSATLWALSQVARRPLPEILSRTKAAGYDVSGSLERSPQKQSDNE